MSNVVLNKNQNEELVKITRNEKGIEVVSTRELYSKLKIERDFTTWFKKMVSYGFEEGKDFTPVRVESTGGRPSVDYGITLDMAMHISMIQRTDEGKELRQYFIDYVKKNESNQPVQQFQLPQTFAEALMLAGKLEEERVKAVAQAEQAQKQLAQVTEVAQEQASQLNEATQEIVEKTKTIEEYKPQVDYAKAVKSTGDSVLVSHLANIITQEGYPIGQNRLYEFLREGGFLGNSGERHNKPYQTYIERGIFEIKYTEYTDHIGNRKMSTVTKVTPKGQEYFLKIFKKAQEV